MSIAWGTPTTFYGIGGEQRFWVEVETNVFASFGWSEGVLLEYNPSTEDFDVSAVTEPTPATASAAAASRLADGRILLAGGDSSDSTYLGTFSAGDFTWVASTDLPFSQPVGHAQTILGDGRIFALDVTGVEGVVWLGEVSGNTISWTEATVTSGTADTVQGARAVTLDDGRVLVAWSPVYLSFATVTDDNVEWEDATVTGGTFPGTPSDPSVAALWPDGVLAGCGFDGSSSDPYPGEYFPNVAGAEIAGTDVDLTDFDPVPVDHPEAYPGFFRLSDGKIAALLFDLETSEDVWVLGTDSNASPIRQTKLSVSAAATAAFVAGSGVDPGVLEVLAGSSTEWVNPGRALQISCPSTAHFWAPSYARLSVASASSADFRASSKVQFSWYLRCASLAAFRARFEKPVALRFYGRSAARFAAVAFVPGGLLSAGNAHGEFHGQVLARVAWSAVAGSSLLSQSAAYTPAVLSAGGGAAANFPAVKFNGGRMALSGAAVCSFTGGAIPVVPWIDIARLDSVHVLHKPQFVYAGGSA